MKRSVGIGIIAFFSTTTLAQVEVKDIDPIVVYGPKSDESGSSVLSKKRAERRLATDIGQLLVLFPGLQLKSYGGLGGMKTVSFRSLSAGHTSVVIDHFALSQTQSGQTDLGQLPVDFIRNLSVIHHAGTSTDYTIHAKLAGQIIAVETRHLPTGYNDSFQLNVGMQAGSFGQLDGHFFVSQNTKHWRFSTSMKGRTFDGAYPFTYQNGATQVRTERTNGDLKDAFGTAAISWSPNVQNAIHLSYSGAQFNKGLPGAVVFYNETAKQRLYGNNHLANIRYTYQSVRWNGTVSAAYQHNKLDYTDPNYLNANNYLHSHFISQQSEAQTQWKYETSNHFRILTGAGFRHEQLQSASLSITPKRLSVDGIFAVKYMQRNNISAQVGIQSVEDQRPTETKRVLVVLPSAEWSYQLTGKMNIATGYRYSVRQPSFNELYYNQIGNDDLRPEKAHLVNLRLDYHSNVKKSTFRTTIQPFYVYATDKILAIPTKNLFIWSIQNVGKSSAYGVEFTQSYHLPVGKSALGLHVNYTFQYTQDLSNLNSPTYRHLLSYSPLHAGTVECSFERKKWGLSALLTYQGQRYALNENIPTNLLEDFLLLDCSAFYSFKVGKKQHAFTIQAVLNNITNNYYSYIRYFVMPGRNFTVKMSFEF